jgi:hypothetical protein
LLPRLLTLRPFDVTEQYHSFLEKCLTFPQLRLGPYPPVPDEHLSQDERYQRDTLFDLLTSIFESAYLAYANRISSHRRRQWGAWDDYMDIFVGRADYRDWWWRIVFGGDPDFLKQSDRRLSELNTSQLDLRFERYMIAKLRQFAWTPQPAAAPKQPRQTKLERR